MQLKLTVFKIHGGVQNMIILQSYSQQTLQADAMQPFPLIDMACTSVPSILSLKSLAEDNNLNIPVPQSRCTKVFASTVDFVEMSCGMP